MVISQFCLRFFILGFLLSCFCFGTWAQSLKVSGQVTETGSGETLIGATVYDTLSQKGTFTNAYGYFQLTYSNPISALLRITYVGFEPKWISLAVSTDTFLTISMLPAQELEEVVVSAIPENISNGDHLRISPKSLQNLPRFGSEVDVISSLQLLPGVQSGLEGTSNFNVRGGSNDQNRIYMDNITIYNTGHLGNLVSIFDPYTINDITFYKNGFPAQYSGALSSVTDIYLREGNKKEVHGEFAIGMLSSKVAVEGPIQKGKSSFLVSYRRSFYDLLLKAGGAGLDPELASYYFNDATIKLNYKVNEKNHIYSSFYLGVDHIDQISRQTFLTRDSISKTQLNKTINSWGNMAAGIRWNHIFHSNSFSNLTLDVTSYSTDLTEMEETLLNQKRDKYTSNFTRSSIQDIEIKYQIKTDLRENISLTYGLQHTFREISPIEQETTFFRNSPAIQYSTYKILKEKGTESSLYSDFKWVVSNNLSVVSGTRLTWYRLSGNVSQYFLEPRIHSTYDISPAANLSFDYARMNQTVSSLNNTTTSLNSKILVPSTDKLRSSQSDQISLTYGQSFPLRDLYFKASAYYKSMRRLIESTSPSSLIVLGSDWEGEILNHGDGYSKGLEFEGMKDYRFIYLNANYTLSKSMRRFTELNNGDYFPFDFDRRHNVTVTSNFQIDKRLSITLLWVYKTGQAITLGDQFFPSHNNYIYSYGFPDHNLTLESPFVTTFEAGLLLDKRNNYRMDEYHRMDISINYEKIKKKGRTAIWNLSIYNAYNRKNPYSIYIRQEGNELKFYQFTLFPIIPSISYSRKF